MSLKLALVYPPNFLRLTCNFPRKVARNGHKSNNLQFIFLTK